MPFSLSGGTENLQIPEYAHAVVMGVNKQRVPGKGSAFFIHSGDGSATAGCVSIDDATLVSLMRWLQPGPLWLSLNSRSEPRWPGAPACAARKHLLRVLTCFDPHCPQANCTPLGARCSRHRDSRRLVSARGRAPPPPEAK